MKKCLLLLLIVILLSGCSITRVDNNSYKDEMNSILSLNIKHYNKIGKGYKYYAPRGMVRKDGESYNDVLTFNNVNYYLYVDVVSYYYKVNVDYKVDKDAYYSKLLNNKNKEGYVEITEVDDKLFVEMAYNYAKIEVYTDKNNLKEVIRNSSYILASMKFNDSLLNKMYEEGNLSSKEEAYYLFDNKEQDGNFLEYIKEYDKYDGSEDTITEETEIKQQESTTTTTKKIEETTTSSAN